MMTTAQVALPRGVQSHAAVGDQQLVQLWGEIQTKGRASGNRQEQERQEGMFRVRTGCVRERQDVQWRWCSAARAAAEDSDRFRGKGHPKHEPPNKASQTPEACTWGLVMVKLTTVILRRRWNGTLGVRTRVVRNSRNLQQQGQQGGAQLAQQGERECDAEMLATVHAELPPPPPPPALP